MEEQRQRIRNRLLKIARETAQFVRDVEWWNRNRTDAGPLDCEPERILLSRVKESLAAFDRGDAREVSRLARLMEEAARDATASAD